MQFGVHSLSSDGLHGLALLGLGQGLSCSTDAGLRDVVYSLH